MANVFLICGKICSGKSTYAKKLAKTHNAVILSVDEIMLAIFDHGAGLLSNVMLSQMDIEPLALLKPLRARPFQTTFMRQVNAARSLTGPQLKLPKLKRAEIQEMLQPLLAYYSPRDKGIISDRVIACVLNQQKKL